MACGASTVGDYLDASHFLAGMRRNHSGFQYSVFGDWPAVCMAFTEATARTARRLWMPGAQVQQIDLVHPAYADSFRCIGSDCEDTCCKGWTIRLDQATIEKHRRLPASSLLYSLCDATGSLNPECTDHFKPATLVQIRMTDAQMCPLLSEDRLCRVQTEYGEEYLPSTCAGIPASSTGTATNGKKRSRSPVPRQRAWCCLIRLCSPPNLTG